jgi:hypothetical protein
VLVPLTDHVAIVPLTREIPMRSILQATAAVQKQITRDFTPFWGFTASVDAFEDLESVPSDYHHVVLFTDPDELTAELEPRIGEKYTAELIDDFEREQLSGLHLNTFTRQPFALVQASDTWSVTLSHEIIEMIIDPFGNRLIAAAHPFEPDVRVKYLLEICDPCQAVWYSVNGVPVSDFYTPRYLDPIDVDSSRYSFTGAIERPQQILEDGYVSWIDPETSGLYRLAAGATEAELVADIMQLARSSAPLRTIVDTSPLTPRLTQAALVPASSARAAPHAYHAVAAASEGTARRTAEWCYCLATGAG